MAERARGKHPWPQPEEAAEGLARRTIATIVDDIAEASQTGRAASAGHPDAEDGMTSACEAATEHLCRNVFGSAAGIEVRPDFADIGELRSRDWKTGPRDVEEALIRMDGPNRIVLECRRGNDGFVLEEVSATEYGHVGTVQPSDEEEQACNTWVSQLLALYEICEAPIIDC